MSKKEVSTPAELSMDIQKLFDNYIVKKVCANTEEQLVALSEASEKLQRKQGEVLNNTADLLNVTYDTNDRLQSLVSDLPEALGKIPGATDKLVTGKLKTINANVVEKTGTILQRVEDLEMESQSRHSALVGHIDAESASAKNELSNLIRMLLMDEGSARHEQAENILARIAELMSTTNQSNLDLRTTLEETHKKSAEMLMTLINERGLQITENEDTNASTLRASIESHTFKTMESVQKIGSDIRKVQVENNEEVKAAIGTLTEIAQEVSQRQESHHVEIVAQIEAFETSHTRKLDELFSLCKNENQHLKRMLYISWAIGGTTLAATIASILIQLL